MNNKYLFKIKLNNGQTIEGRYKTFHDAVKAIGEDIKITSFVRYLL